MHLNTCWLGPGEACSPADALVQPLWQVHCVGDANYGQAGALAPWPVKQVVQHSLQRARAWGKQSTATVVNRFHRGTSTQWPGHRESCHACQQQVQSAKRPHSQLCVRTHICCTSTNQPQVAPPSPLPPAPCPDPAHLCLVDQHVHLIHQHDDGALCSSACPALTAEHLLQRVRCCLRPRPVAGERLLEHE